MHPEHKRSHLFTTWEGGGNVPPVLGLAQRLVARGHRVRILAEPCLEAAVCHSSGVYPIQETLYTH